MKFLQVFVMDDDLVMHQLYRRIFKDLADWELSLVNSVTEAKKAFLQKSFDVALLDLRLDDDPDAGFVILKHLKKQSPAPDCIIISAETNFKAAQKALRCGADDFLAKGFSRDELCFVLEQAKARIRWKGLERQACKEVISARERYYIHGQTSEVLKLKRQIEKLAAKTVPVLIHAETGTGKE
jgi:DNA-binding NtrC family response regulator